MRAHNSKALQSRIWLTPDLALGFHHFDYSLHQYDGLAHTHGEYCIVIGLCGAIEVVRGTQLDRVESGETLVVNPGQIHRCAFGVHDSHSEGLTLILRPQTFRSMWDAMSFPYSHAHDLRFEGKVRDSSILRLAGELIDEFEQKRRGWAVVTEGLIRQILIHLLRIWPSHSIVPVRLSLERQLPWVYMHRAMEYMNAHGKGDFRLSELCTEVGVSPSRFIPLFKNSAGITPHIYYNSLLIHKARFLLREERCSTKDTAYALGFRNVSHFCALYHQMTGRTPQFDQEMINAKPARVWE